MVPFTRNPSFIGRDAYLKDLAVRIELGDRHSRVALVGLGGVGYRVSIAPFSIPLVLTNSSQQVSSCYRIRLPIS